MNPAPLPEALRHFYIAQAQEANDWHDRALGEIDQAIKLDPSNPDFYVLKTKILLAQDKSTDGVEVALAAMARSPQTIKTILDLSGEFYLPEAKTVYNKAIEMGYRETTPYLGLGKIALHRRELEEAEKWFGLAKQMAGEKKETLLWWGRLQFEKGELEKAKDFLEQAKAKGEDSDVLYGALGETYSRLEQWEQAAGAYREALRRKRNVDWRRSLGIALAKLGRVGEAEEKFREVLATRSDDIEAWKELGKIGKRY
jgi:tetratricopeptide (TPR) repeat protein